MTTIQQQQQMDYSDKNERLFFSLWRNRVIRNQIFHYVSLFGNFIDRDFKIFKDKGYQEWINYQYKNKIENIYLFIGGKDSVQVNFNRVKSILKSMDNDDECNLKNVHIELSSHGYKSELDFGIDLFPSSIESINLTGYFGTILPMDTFLKNKNLKSISLYNSFDQPLVNKRLKQSLFGNCNNLTYLDFGCGSFNSDIPVNSFPVNLLKLQLSYMFNKRIVDNVLPNGLTSLEFGEHFNTSLPILPPNLKILKFGRDFNKSIDSTILPNGLEELIFNIDFNQKIQPNVLPKTLKYLVFGHQYNYDLPKGVLPESLTTLEFDPSGTFKKSIDISNLNKLINLSLFRCDNLKNELKLPSNITNLKFGSNYSGFDILLKSILPLKQLKSLDITSVQQIKSPIVLGQLPITLTNLKFNLINSFTKNALLSLINLIDITSPSFNSLPNSITHFKASYNFKNRISKNDIPLNIVHLDFQGYPSTTDNDIFIDHGALVNCVNLTSLNLGKFNQPIGINGQLFFPKNLIHLQFNYPFNSILNCSILPTTLKTLKFDNYYTHDLNGLPNSLVLLSIPYYNAISNSTLPNSLQHLILPTKTSNFDKDFKVPDNLTIYTFHENYSIVYNVNLFNHLFNNLKLSNNLRKIFNDIKNSL